MIDQVGSLLDTAGSSYSKPRHCRSSYPQKEKLAQHHWIIDCILVPPLDLSFWSLLTFLLPRFHDSCVPVCISFLISSVSSLGVCLLSGGASLRSSILISSVSSLGICLLSLSYFWIFLFFFQVFILCIFLFCFLFLFFYPSYSSIFRKRQPPPPPPPRCQMAVHRTVPHSGPSRPLS